MFTFRTRGGWHALGKQAPADMIGIDQWVTYTGMDYPVVTVPTYIDLADIDVAYARGILATMGDADADTYDGAHRWIEDPLKRAVIRPDTGDVFAHVGNVHKIVRPTITFKPLQTLIDRGLASIVTMGALGNGETYWALVQIEDDYKLGASTLRTYILARASYDSTTALVYANVDEYVVCANTLGAAMREDGRKIRVRHTNNMIAKIETTIPAQLTFAINNGLALREALAKMAEIKVTDELRTKIANIVVPECAADATDLVRERNQQERLLLWRTLSGDNPAALSVTDDSVLSLYNGATEYAQWLRPQRRLAYDPNGNVDVRAMTERVMVDTAYGKGADTRQRVFDALIASMAAPVKAKRA